MSVSILPISSKHTSFCGPFSSRNKYCVCSPRICGTGSTDVGGSGSGCVALGSGVGIPLFVSVVVGAGVVVVVVGATVDEDD